LSNRVDRAYDVKKANRQGATRRFPLAGHQFFPGSWVSIHPDRSFLDVLVRKITAVPFVTIQKRVCKSTTPQPFTFRRVPKTVKTLQQK
jgi:hypothetical protein